MENGLVNIINHGPAGRYRHAIICLTCADEFRARLRSDKVLVIELHKRPGKDLWVYARLWRALRELKPSIVHSRNLSAVDTPLVAFLARVPVRIHGEHGRDVFDLRGTNQKYRILRRLMAHFVTHYVTVSKDLSSWLQETIDVPAARITQIYNGVDTAVFHPSVSDSVVVDTAEKKEPVFVVGHVGRFETVKDQPTLARAFVRLHTLASNQSAQLRLWMVGAGTLIDEVRQIFSHAGLDDHVWFAGSREDVAELMRKFDAFVLPSISEGISNTIIEAMATGVPIVATRVGGNPELVIDGETGLLVGARDEVDMAAALERYLHNPTLREQHAKAGLERAKREFSISTMVDGYYSLYDRLLAGSNR